MIPWNIVAMCGYYCSPETKESSFLLLFLCKLLIILSKPLLKTFLQLVYRFLPRNKPFSFRSFLFHPDEHQARIVKNVISWFFNFVLAFSYGNRIIQPDDGEVYYVLEAFGHKLVGTSCALTSLHRQLIRGRSRRGRRTLQLYVFPLCASPLVDFGHRLVPVF